MLWISRWTDGDFVDRRVGSAGEWFGGLAGFLVLWWAVGEPTRQRTRDAQSEAHRRVASARSVVLHDRHLAYVGDLGRPSIGVVKELRGQVGNYSEFPIRVVRLIVDWTMEAHLEVTRADRSSDATGNSLFARRKDKLYEFTLVDALAPDNCCPVVVLEEPIYFVLDKERSNHEDIAHLRIVFFDVHGDEWMGWFGPQGNEAHIQLHIPHSPFWTKSLQLLIPPIPPEYLAFVAAAEVARKDDTPT